MRPLRYRYRDSFSNLVAGLGTGKDKRAHGEFGRRALDPTQLEAMYEFDAISGKVVDIPVKDALRNWRTIKAPSVEDKMNEIAKAEKDSGIRQTLERAQKWADLYRGAIIVMIVRGDTPVWEPLDPNTVGLGDLERLEVFDSTEVSIQVRNTNDVTRPDYRRPSSYSIASGQMIHASRVLHFEGYDLPWRPRVQNAYWGGGKLQRFYDALRNSRSTTDSIASMIYEAKLDVISVPELYQEIAGPEGVDKIIERFMLGDQVKSINNTLLLDDRETFQRNATQFSGLHEIMSKFAMQVSAAADIPATRLFGQSAIGLNATGEGDQENYDDRIMSDQETHFRPAIERFDEVFVRSTLGAMPDDWAWEWNPLREKDQARIADTRLKDAQRHQIDLQNDIVTPGIVAQVYQKEGVYELTDEYVEELLAVDAAPEPDPMPQINPFEQQMQPPQLQQGQPEDEE